MTASARIRAARSRRCCGSLVSSVGHKSRALRIIMEPDGTFARAPARFAFAESIALFTVRSRAAIPTRSPALIKAERRLLHRGKKPPRARVCLF